MLLALSRWSAAPSLSGSDWLTAPAVSWRGIFDGLLLPLDHARSPHGCDRALRDLCIRVVAVAGALDHERRATVAAAGNAAFVDDGAHAALGMRVRYAPLPRARNGRVGHVLVASLSLRSCSRTAAFRCPQTRLTPLSSDARVRSTPGLRPG
jgi:hypothetical protein